MIVGLLLGFLCIYSVEFRIFFFSICGLIFLVISMIYLGEFVGGIFV